MISIIIPTLNEAARLSLLLAELRAETEAHEIIVVDGGSGDGSAAVARDHGADRVLTAPRGRGPQLVAGADAASGEVLLFLHGDSRFPRGGLTALRRELAEHPEAHGGNFSLLFDGDDGFSRWLEEFYAGIRARGFYYGDSGIFVRRWAYDVLGGLRPLALMEDYDFVRRLERAGPTLCIAEPPLVTSSRRFGGRSKSNIVLGWIKIHLLYHLRLPGALLARLYDSERRVETKGVMS